MRTNIDIDDELLAQAFSASHLLGVTTVRPSVQLRILLLSSSLGKSRCAEAGGPRRHECVVGQFL